MNQTTTPCPPQKIQKLPEGHLRVFLPEGIDPYHPSWGKGERRARIAYVGHRISTHRYDDKRKFVTIHSSIMRSHINSEAWTAATVILGPYLAIASYQAGEYSKGYRWKKPWRNHPFKEHHIWCPNFKIRLAGIHEKQIALLSPIEHGIFADMQTLECTIVDIDHFIQTLPPKLDTEIHSSPCRITYYRNSIYQIHERTYNIGKRGRTNRLYHSLTRTPKLVRQCLTLAGERAVEVDLANSQPFFMALIFPGVPGLIGSVCAGTFYEDINVHLSTPYDLTHPDQKQDLKKRSLSCLYAKNKGRFLSNLYPESDSALFLRALDKAFPGLPQLIEAYAKKYGEKALAHEMQRRESSVFIDQAIPRFQELKIPAIPIHDSILCRESDADAVKQILESILFGITGRRPTLR
jgi:hypothetical protein